jgi:hypothetical protein
MVLYSNQGLKIIAVYNENLCDIRLELIVINRPRSQVCGP